MRRKYASRVPREDTPTYMGMRNKDGGLAILSELERAVRAGECVVRSNDILTEFKVFDRDAETGKPVFPKGEKGHGDRIMGLAMAWFQARERLTAKPEIEVSREAAKHEIERFSHEKRTWTECWSLRKGRYAI